MKKLYLILLTAVSFNLISSAQKISGTVKGVLQDSVSATYLADATVSVVRTKDSSLISFTLTNNSGKFEIKNLDAGEYKLISSFTGLQTISKKFIITTQDPVADFGLIKFDRFYKTLDEVVINDAPVKVNGDTLSFRADAFKTKPNATVEDLLKKLPGMQVEKDGTVKAQGEQVQKVYVDGKEFFGSDPKLATKNLTADMVDQVELFDDMSEQSKFNKIDDGSRSKSINLKLKKDKKKGVFGKAYAGYGTNDRYEAGITANLFKGATQTSIIAKANNTNNISFTSTDMLGMFGGGGGNFGGSGNFSGGGFGGGGTRVVSMGGGGGSGNFGGLNLTNTGNGITSSSQAGINYRDTWNKHFDVNGSYFFNHTQTQNLRKSLRQTFANDTTYFNNQQTNAFSQNNNHRFNLNMVYTIDSMNSIIYSPNLSFQNSINNSNDTASYYYMAHGFSQQQNESRSFNNGSGNGYNFNNNLIWRKKFTRAGRTLSVNLSGTAGNSSRESYNIIKAKINPRDVFSSTEGETRNYGLGFSYTEPLARNKILEFNYSYNRNRSESDKETFKYNTTTNKYDIGYDTLTNHFQNLNEYHRAGANFRVVQKKYNYQVGVSAQQTLLQSNNFTKNNFQSQRFTNLFPTASFNYQFARSRSLRFNYRGSTRQPTISQLQEVLDISNTPYFYKGNASLKQEFSNNFVLSYNFFDIVKFRNVFALVTYSNTRNKISNSVTINPDGTQLTVPVNINGYYSLNGNFNVGFPIKKMKGGNFNTSTRINLTNDPGLYQGQKNYTRNLALGEDLRLNYNYKEKLDLGIVASVNYNSVHYTNTSRFNPDQSYFTHTYSADATYSFSKGFILSSDFDYTFNTGRNDGFNQNYAIWNGSFAKELFKKKRGELKATVFDILDQNISVARNVGSNYIEDVQSSVLNRFFMLTFTYKLNRMGGRAMPGMMQRGMRNMK